MEFWRLRSQQHLPFLDPSSPITTTHRHHPHDAAGSGGAEIGRPWPGGHFLCGGGLPTPPFADVARAPAAGSLVPARPHRRLPRPILQALVGRVPFRVTLSRLHGVHALISALRSSVRTLRDGGSWPWLAPVSNSLPPPSLELLFCLIFFVFPFSKQEMNYPCAQKSWNLLKRVFRLDFLSAVSFFSENSFHGFFLEFNEQW